MSTPLSTALAEMRRQFADQLGTRLATIREHFDRIDIGDWKVGEVEALHRQVHGLTGSAGTFGMNSISDCARSLEQQISALIRAGAAPPPPAWAEAQAALVRLERLASVRLVSDAPSLAPMPARATASGAPPLIHLVEDDPEQADALSDALKTHGYPVRVFNTIADFHAACAGGDTPAAVVMDMIFADDDLAGAHAISRLTAGQADVPPVVFVSVRDDVEARLAAYRAGAARYFTKPVNTANLNRVLDELTGRMPPDAWRVLLVDDDPLMLRVQAEVLRQSGMEVKTVVEPLKALDAVRDFKPDVLVLDVYMPDATGPELAAVLREQEAYAHLPILFLSAETDMGRQLMALGLGGDDFLVKPVQPAHLIAAVSARARRARQNAEMMGQLREIIYEREREHLALNQHAIVSITDSAGNITYVNEKLTEASGHTTEDLIGRNHRIVKSGAHSPEFYANMWSTIAAGRIWRGELCNRDKNGELYWVESTITPFLDAEGKPYQYVAICTEITALKQREEELREARQAAEGANRAKSDFLSSMSHELRTPMNAILGFGQLLEFDDTLSADHKDHVREILKAGRHLLNLINEVLDLAKVESGRIDLSLETVALAGLADECISLMRPLANERAIDLRLQGLDGQAVRADRARLRQVLLNLLSNAVKYNHPAGSITLGVQPSTRGNLRLAVSDTGPGIAPERMNELFQPFNRLDAESSAIEGTGIGLVITRRLVDMMGGSVGAESTPGSGSTFWIELPAAILAEEEKTESAEASDAGTAGRVAMAGKQVLYIEDNPANLRLVAQILGRQPHLRIVTAHAPELGIELAMAHRPDLILLDINMPGLDGYQVLEILKADARLKGTPVIAITANAMPDDIQRGKAAGFVEYLTKPLDVDRFLKAIDRWLK